MEKGQSGPLALVLAPTHELAEQLYRVATRLADGTGVRGLAMYGGVAMHQQRTVLKQGIEFAVATPGRLHDHVSKGHCDLSRCSFVVLDEADRMLSMGFRSQVDDIVRLTRRRGERQTLLLSATLNKRVETLASQVLERPIRVSVGAERGEMNRRVVQVIEVLAQDSHKFDWLVERLPRLVVDGQVLVFVSTKRQAAQLATRLATALAIRQKHAAVKVSLEALHGDMTGPARMQAMSKYKKGYVSSGGSGWWWTFESNQLIPRQITTVLDWQMF